MERKGMGIGKSFGTPVQEYFTFSLISLNVEFVGSNVER